MPVSIIVLFAIAGILIVLMIVSTVWQFSVPVPFVPSFPRAVIAMIEQADLRPGERILDLGAGDGRVLRAAVRACPGVHAVAVETVPTTYALGRFRSWLARDAIHWHRGSLFDYNLQHVDCLFLYLYPKVMERLLPTLDAQLPEGARVVSHDFPFHGRVPLRVVEVPHGRRPHKIYVYDWPARQS
jgi:SAM-dependent methyltransferase